VRDLLVHWKGEVIGYRRDGWRLNDRLMNCNELYDLVKDARGK
jgi:hypothetical protein